MSILIEEKVIQIMALTGLDYEISNNLVDSVGGGYSNAEKTVLLLKRGFSVDKVKELNQKGLFKYDIDAIVFTLNARLEFDK